MVGVRLRVGLRLDRRQRLEIAIEIFGENDRVPPILVGDQLSLSDELVRAVAAGPAQSLKFMNSVRAFASALGDHPLHGRLHPPLWMCVISRSPPMSLSYLAGKSRRFVSPLLMQYVPTNSV